MPIDYFKGFYRDPSPSILENPNLDFNFSVNDKTGEVETKLSKDGTKIIKPRYATNGHLSFIYSETETISTGSISTSLRVDGSIHKYYNYIVNPHFESYSTNGYNGNDFHYSDMVDTWQDFSSRFDLPLNKLILQNVEAGVNISPSVDVNLILDGLLMHHGRTFSEPISSRYRQLKHAHYLLKYYNKASQYNLPNNIMRVENKWRKMSEVNNCGIYRVSDLLNMQKVNALLMLVNQRWNETLFYDYTVDVSKLNTRQLMKTKDYSNTTYWKQLNANHRDRPKKELRSLVARYSDNIQNSISDLIKEKANHLLTECVMNDHSIIG